MAKNRPPFTPPVDPVRESAKARIKTRPNNDGGVDIFVDGTFRCDTSPGRESALVDVLVGQLVQQDRQSADLGEMLLDRAKGRC